MRPLTDDAVSGEVQAPVPIGVRRVGLYLGRGGTRGVWVGGPIIFRRDMQALRVEGGMETLGEVGGLIYSIRRGTEIEGIRLLLQIRFNGRPPRGGDVSRWGGGCRRLFYQNFRRGLQRGRCEVVEYG